MICIKKCKGFYPFHNLKGQNFKVFTKCLLTLQRIQLLCLQGALKDNDSSGMKLTSLLPKCISFKCIYLYDILIESWFMLLFLISNL